MKQPSAGSARRMADSCYKNIGEVKMTPRHVLLISTASFMTLISGAAFAQDVPPADAAPPAASAAPAGGEGRGLEEIVVSAAPR